MLMRWLVSLGVSLAFTHCAKAQHFTDQRIQDIDQLIETRLDETRIPGAAVVLVEDGRIVHTRGFGLAEIETGTPATSDTVFAIGSVTKSFVSNTLLQLERDGLIDLEAPVITYLPAFQSASKAMSDTITVRQLMEHTSGFSTYDGNRNQTNSRRTDDALAKVSAQTMKYKLNRPVGRSFEYSNANYEVLGHLIESVTGASFQIAIEEWIFNPLEMNRSGVLNDGSSKTAPAYRFVLSTPQPFEFSPGAALGPKGGVYTTAEDMGLYLIALMNARSPIASWDSSWASGPDTTVESSYGPGWMVSQSNLGPLVKHNGMNGGYSALAGFAPESGLGFAIMANASQGLVAGDIPALTEDAFAVAFDRPIQGLRGHQSAWTQLVLIGPMLIGLAIWIAMFLLNTIAGALSKRSTTLLAVSQIVLPGAILATIAWLVIYQIPRQFGLPLEAIRLFVPDIGWVLTFLGYGALSFLVVRSACLLLARHGKR